MLTTNVYHLNLKLSTLRNYSEKDLLNIIDEAFDRSLIAPDKVYTGDHIDSFFHVGHAYSEPRLTAGGYYEVTYIETLDDDTGRDDGTSDIIDRTCGSIINNVEAAIEAWNVATGNRPIMTWDSNFYEIVPEEGTEEFYKFMESNLVDLDDEYFYRDTLGGWVSCNEDGIIEVLKERQ